MSSGLEPEMVHDMIQRRPAAVLELLALGLRDRPTWNETLERMAMVKGMRRSLREVIGARGLVLDGDERMDSIMNFATADELVGWIRRAATASSPEEFFDAAPPDVATNDKVT